MIFESLFILGLAGVGLVALLGSAHVGHHGASVGGHHAGAPGHLPAGGHHLGIVHGHGSTAVHGHGLFARLTGRGARAQRAVQSAHGTQGVAAQHRHISLFSFIPSPLDAFSLCFGAGAVGMLATGHLAPRLVTLVAIFGAIVFDLGVVRPLFAAFFTLANNPSRGLEGVVAMPAQAMTRFDAKGQGLVCLNMEGQLVQILARLSPDDIAGGVEVQKGDQVIVTEVDVNKNVCQVTRQLSL